jgi:hypothetical protein
MPCNIENFGANYDCVLRFITMQFAHGRWNTTMTPREESEAMLRKDSVI